MAPRRGGGGGSRGGSSFSSNSCPGAFQSIDSPAIPYFVAYCIFFVVNFFIAINAPKIKKKHPHVKATKLISWLFGFCVLFFLLGYALLIISTMLRECDTVGLNVYYQFAVAFRIFFLLAQYLLLILVLASVNSTLRKTVGNNPAFLTIIYAVIATFLFIIFAAYVGLDSYLISSAYSTSLILSTYKLGLAYYIFYMLTVLLAGAGAITSIVQLRSARKPTGHLTFWVPCLYFSMFVWIVFNVALQAAAIDPRTSITTETYEAFEYITDFFQAFSLIAILFIAKDTALANHPAGVVQPVYDNGYAPQQPPQQQQQQQYAYNTQPQQYGYGQPVYQIAGTPINHPKP